MGVLVAAGDGLDLGVLAANLAGQRRQVLRAGHHVHGMSSRIRRVQGQRERQQQDGRAGAPE